jgi:hypothetical protein
MKTAYVMEKEGAQPIRYYLHTVEKGIMPPWAFDGVYLMEASNDAEAALEFSSAEYDYWEQFEVQTFL